jgi:hypothetical protein
MMSQPYVHGITDTVTHDIASSLTAGHIAADGNTLSVAVVCPDRWFPGDVAVITSRDGGGDGSGSNETWMADEEAPASGVPAIRR